MSYAGLVQQVRSDGGWPSSAIDALRSPISAVSSWMRLARLRSPCLVAVSSLWGCGPGRNAEPLVYQASGGEISGLVL